MNKDVAWILNVIEEACVILTGSHRDPVRQGGRYDGMLGVLTALKAAGSSPTIWTAVTSAASSGNPN